MSRGSPDVIVIGGGLNGLVAGAWLARKKLATLIIDQRPTAGGAAITSDIAPGFRAPALSHAFGPLHANVIRALDLDRAGLEFLSPDPAVTALGPSGQAMMFHRDPVLTAAAIHRVSPADASRWQPFLQSVQRLGAVIAELQRHPPPDIDDIRVRDWWKLLGVGRRVRSLAKHDLSRLLRWMPTPVADIATECFEHDLLHGVLGARALFGHIAGPRAAGTGALLLQRMAQDDMPVGSMVTARGGPGAVTAALAALAEKARAEVATGVRVVRITTSGGRATGVVLDDGREIPARAIIAAIDPRAVFANLVDPGDVPMSFRERVRLIRGRGVTAKINLAVSALPSMPALDGDAVPMRGRFLIAPSLEYLDHAHDAAKYGAISDAPWIELAIPSVADPSLAPAGAHVVSIYAQCAPRQLRAGSWDQHRDTLYRRVLDVIRPHMPDLERLIVASQIITPEDLERDWGLPGGHVFHGECTIEQSWIARPLMGSARYRTPVASLFLGSAGTHPGGGLTGLPGLLSARTVLDALHKRRQT